MSDEFEQGLLSVQCPRMRKIGKLFSPDQMQRAQSLVYTSVNECRSSLHHETDLKTLSLARDIATSLGQRTRPKLIQRRIDQLMKNELRSL